MSKNLLSLATVVDRDTIKIDEKDYEVLSYADFGPLEWAMIVRRDTEARELAAKKRPTKKQKDRVAALLRETVRQIVPSLEPRVMRGMTDQQLEMIVFAWSNRVAEQAHEAEGKRNPPRAGNRPTGSKSSRASKPSTAATRRPGGTRRTGS